MALLLAACSFSLQNDLSQVPAPPVKPGTIAPAFTGVTLDSEPISLKDYAGKPIVLNFWASWCVPCRKEQPGLNQLSKEFQGQGVQFLGINFRDSLGNARAFRDEFQVKYPSVFDRPAELAARYQVYYPPSTVLISARGEMLYRSPGALEEAQLRRLILINLLGQPNPSALTHK